MPNRIAAFVLSASTVAALQPPPGPCTVPVPDGEAIAPYGQLHITAGDYRNVRGFNYLAVYPSLNALSRDEAPLEWKGVASSTAMWEHYEPTGITAREVHEQLRLMKSVGVNMIRVFMSFPCWEFHHRRANATGQPNAYNLRLADFFRRCELNGIKCMPVIWDNTGAGSVNPPRYGSATDYYSPNNFHAWHSNPGVAQLQSMLAPTGNFIGTLAETYIADLVAAANTSSSVELWEIINEPFAVLEPLLGQVIRSTVQALDSRTTTPILLGLPWWDHNTHQYARMPGIDALSVHHLGHTSTSSALHSMVWNATHIRISPTQTTAAPFVQKPILLAECGSPGFGHSYADAITQSMNVPRPDLGPSERGAGFLSFSANVGWQRGNYLLKFQSGMFYGDGSVRDLVEAQAFATAAGITLPPFVQKPEPPPPPCPHASLSVDDSPACAGFVRQGPISAELHDYSDRVVWMNATNQQLMGIGFTPGCPPTFAKYIEMRDLFRTMFQSITAAGDAAFQWDGSAALTPGGLANGNPYSSAGTAPPFTVVPLATRLMIQNWFDHTALQTDSAGMFIPTAFTNGIVAQTSAGPLFDPRIHHEHLAVLCLEAFEPLRVAMREYVLAQQ